MTTEKLENQQPGEGNGYFPAVAPNAEKKSRVPVDRKALRESTGPRTRDKKLYLAELARGICSKSLPLTFKVPQPEQVGKKAYGTLRSYPRRGFARGLVRNGILCPAVRPIPRADFLRYQLLAR